MKKRRRKVEKKITLVGIIKSEEIIMFEEEGELMEEKREQRMKRV